MKLHSPPTDAANAPSVAARAKMLRIGGYEPIPVAGKRPTTPAWQKVDIGTMSDEEMSAAFEEGRNIGLRTGGLVAVDIDTWDAGETEAHIALAEKMLGPTPFQRRGQKGMVLCYGNDAPIEKITAAPGDKADKNKVEILGKGQQVVAYGTHPVTGKAYEWICDADPYNVGAYLLPRVTPDQLLAYAGEAAALLERQGHTGAKVSGAGVKRDRPADDALLDNVVPIRRYPPKTPDEIEKMVRCLDPNMGRDEWLRVAAGLRDIECTDPAFDKFGLFADWSGGGKEYQGPDDCERIYNDMEPKAGDPRAIHAGTLVRMARAAGYRVPGETVSEAFGHFAKDHADTPIDEFHAWTLDELERLPPVEWLIPGVLQTDGFAILYGPTNKGKTFALLALLLPLTLKGHDIIYVTGTGESSKAAIGQRARAWGKHHGPDAAAAARKHFRVMDKAPFESEAKAVCFCKSMEAQGLRPAVVVIDTLSAAMEGDENAAKDVQAFFKIAGVAEALLKCLTFLVHHTGKDVARGERGNSRIRGGVNTSFELTHEDGDDYVALHNRKQREAEKLNAPLCFRWVTVDGTLVYLPATDEDRKRESGRRLIEQRLKPVFKAITDLKRKAPDGVITTHVLASSLEVGAKKKRGVEELAQVVKARGKWLQRQVWDGEKKTYGPLSLWVLQDDITGKPIIPYIWIDASTEDVEHEA